VTDPWRSDLGSGSRGIEVWTDEEIPGGKDVPEALAGEIARSSAVVLVVTTASHDVYREVTVAGKYGKPIILVVREPTKLSPRFDDDLAGTSQIDAREPTTATFDRIARAVAVAKPTPRRQPSRWPTILMVILLTLGIGAMVGGFGGALVTVMRGS
jgi:hypothetical protein